jgi:hypothetical protein
VVHAWSFVRCLLLAQCDCQVDFALGCETFSLAVAYYMHVCVLNLQVRL